MRSSRKYCEEKNQTNHKNIYKKIQNQCHIKKRNDEFKSRLKTRITQQTIFTIEKC